MSKYLMLDHGGVLDGEIIVSNPTVNDLVLYEVEPGIYGILKNGVQIVQQLNVLVLHYDYQLVFHSKNSEEDQLRLLEQLTRACQQKGISFPQITAMAVFDAERYPAVPPHQSISQVNPHGFPSIYYGIEYNKKQCVRAALEHHLSIKPKERKKHIVFDDGLGVVEAAYKESYQVVWIGDDVGQMPLYQAINQIYQQSIVAEAPIQPARTSDETSRRDPRLFAQVSIESEEEKKYHSLIKPTPDEIIPGILLGNLVAGEEGIQKLLYGDTNLAILRCTSHVFEPTISQQLQAIEYLQCFKHFPLKDTPQENLIDYLAESFDFIETALSQNKQVLIHCDAGVSRSASVVIAYLMRKYGNTIQEAHNLVQQKRPCIDIQNFAQQLQHYEQELKIKTASTPKLK